MAQKSQFTVAGFALRFVFALALVFLTYNPSGHSYFHWVSDTLADGGTLGPLHYFAGVVLIIGWVMFVRATFRSLGGVGIFLAAAFLGTLVWLLTDYDLVPADNTDQIVWIALVCTAGLLAAGMSWSHIRRRLSGQADVDDVDED